MFALPKLIYRNKLNLPSLPPQGTFKDQTILITGASGGLGLATAVHFVNLGAASVIITTRTAEKGAAAKATIETQTGTTGKDVVKIMELDMSTFEGIKDFADRVKKEVKVIDYVLLNAGLFNTSFKMGKEGFEETVEVNCISTTLLALLLLPWIKENGRGQAHLGFVTSGLHRSIDISPGKWPQEHVLAYFNKKGNFPKGGNYLYGPSKLLEQYCVNEIAKLALGPDGAPQVIVNPMCPGMVKSDLARGFQTNFLMTFIVNLFMTVVSKSTEGGARTLVMAATTNPAENGMYFTNYQTDEEYRKEAEKSVFGPEGQKMQAEVWKEVIAVLGDRVPEVKRIVNA